MLMFYLTIVNKNKTSLSFLVGTTVSLWDYVIVLCFVVNYFVYIYSSSAIILIG